MTEYEFTKQSTKVGTTPFWIKVETEDFEFLEFMDREVDKLIKQYYRSENDD